MMQENTENKEIMRGFDKYRKHKSKDRNNRKIGEEQVKRTIERNKEGN
jgi:hypothetical protein